MKGLTEKVGATDILAAIIVVAVGLYFVWPSDGADTQQATPKVNLTLPDGVSAHDKAIVVKVVKRMFHDCPNFRTYWTDVRGGEIKVTLMPDQAYYWMHNRWGWTSVIGLEFTIRRGNINAPNDWHIWGHRLYYQIGDGRKPGFTFGKTQAANFCRPNIATDGHGNGFVTDPYFRLVGTLDPRDGAYPPKGPILGRIAWGEDTRVPVNKSKPMTAYNKSIATMALKILLHQCPGLEKYQSDFVSATGSTDPAQWSAHGWGRTVTFEFITRSPKTIPASYGAYGAHLDYTLGGAPHPGIAAFTQAAVNVCEGFPAGAKPKTVLPVPAMKLVDELQ